MFDGCKLGASNTENIIMKNLNILAAGLLIICVILIRPIIRYVKKRGGRDFKPVFLFVFLNS